MIGYGKRLDIFIQLKKKERKKKEKKEIIFSCKNNFNLMKVFSFRSIRRLTSHKATEEFMETTEFRDSTEKREREASFNWLVNRAVT